MSEQNKSHFVVVLIAMALTFSVTYLGTRPKVSSLTENKDMYRDLWLTERDNIKIEYVYVNDTRFITEYIPEYIYIDNNLEYFPDLDILEQFLLDDNVSQYHYSANFTCLGFAIELSKRGAEKGWMLGVYADYHHRDNSTRHAYVITRIPDQWVIIEPQTDKIVWMWDNISISSRAQYTQFEGNDDG